MRTSREPVLIPVAIRDLRPTQLTVGLREVERKRRQWREEGDAGGAYLGRVIAGGSETSFHFVSERDPGKLVIDPQMTLLCVTDR